MRKLKSTVSGVCCTRDGVCDAGKTRHGRDPAKLGGKSHNEKRLRKALHEMAMALCVVLDAALLVVV